MVFSNIVNSEFKINRQLYTHRILWNWFIFHLFIFKH